MDYTAQVQAVADAQTQVDKMTAAAVAADQANQQAIQNLQGARSILATAKDTLNTAMAAGGTVGTYSTVDQLLQKERFAGKSACIDFVKANPTCAEADAIAAWTAAGIAATGLTALIVPAATYEAMFEQNLLALKLIPEATWANLQAWMVATDKTIIMES